MKKRNAARVFAAAVVCMVAGCGKGTATDGPSVEGTAAPAADDAGTESQESQKAAEPGKKVVITVLDWLQ